MMKKIGLVLLAAVLVFGVIVGCSDKPKPPPGGQETVIFKLSDELADMVIAGAEVDTVLDCSSTSTLFKDKKIVNAGDIILKFVQLEGGTYAAQIDTNESNWGAGLDLVHSAIGFKTGDKIKVTGQILEEFPAQSPTADWSKAQIYFACDPGGNPKTKEENSPPVGAFSFDHTLTAANINEINKSNPSNIRIGARPEGAKFRIDEITVTRIVAATPPVTYTVTFVGEDKETVLGTVTGVESGLVIARPTEEWYTTFISSIPAGKELKGWHDKADDAEFKFSTSAVTADITIYPVVGEKKLLPDGFFKLTYAEDGKTWGTDGTDGNTTDLTWETFIASKYLIIEAVSLADSNGFGGLGIALQGDIDSWGWHEYKTGNWTSLNSDIEYNDDVPFYIVIELGDDASWATIITGTQAKFVINGSPPPQITLGDGYLTSVTLTKPAAGVDFNSSIGGWAVKDIPEEMIVH